MAKRKLKVIAPDGTVLTRTTHRDYSHMVAIVSDHRQEKEGWSSWSWAGREDLAQNKLNEAKKLGYEAVIIPVEQEKKITGTTGEERLNQFFDNYVSFPGGES